MPKWLDMKENKWIPIHKAPKDGTVILCCDCDTVMDIQMCFYKKEGWYAYMSNSYFKPTHYMPVPDLPEPNSLQNFSNLI